ncbi:MAG: outer membrane beta-barrel protein [Pseudobdellovibrionaceae bacterium]
MDYKYKVLTGCATLLLSVQAFADEQKTLVNPLQGLEINGSFDFYYQGSSQGHAPIPATPAGPQVLEGRYFDRHVNQLTLNMAEISFKKKTGKVTFQADLAAGEMVDQLNSGGSQSVTGTNPTNIAANEPTRNITQAILSYAASDRLTLSAGKFYSPVGFETTKAKDNWQYSRSYIFNYGPFWHEGVRGTYALVPDKFSATVHVVNAWDGRISQEQNKATTVGLNLSFTGADGLAVNYNYMGGAESTDGSRREVHEINASYNINAHVSIAGDYVSGSQKNIVGLGDAKWSGFALYLKAALNDVYTLSPRYELFDDSDKGFVVAGGLVASGLKQKITAVTLSNNFNLGDGLEARLELRSDKSDAKGFFKSADGTDSDHQESVTAAFLYSF